MPLECQAGSDILILLGGSASKDMNRAHGSVVRSVRHFFYAVFMSTMLLCLWTSGDGTVDNGDIGLEMLREEEAFFKQNY